ncbi:U-box domain-containing protein 33 [Morella rubra]|uniref:RING-type E3 ubiquitin transferase n=1 Tax=Morella rubra TaxID=262757 RepID=A0A6A1VQU2_9ROSI|nr:U-box domain-containing protein 33 [Morella rubra]
MANRGNEEDEVEDEVEVEDVIFVAVGKDVKEGKSVLLWALKNSGGKKICILHVHEPAQRIPFMGTKAPAKSLTERIVREHWEAERKEMHVILDEYLLFCRQMGVRAQKLQIEMYSIEKGIVELISKHKIQKLVMGAAAEKHHKREASRDTEIGDSNRWQSVTLGHNRGSTAPGQSHCLPARCVTLRNNSKSSGSGIFQMTPPEGTEELSSPKARLDAEGSSDEWERLSRSPAGSGCSTGSPMVDVTLTAWNDQGSDSGLELNALSPALVYSRSPFTMELPSSSQQPSPELISSVSNMSTSSSNGALSAVDAVFDNTLYEQLQQAMAEAEKETRRRQKAERDKIETVRRAKEELVQRKEFEKSLAKEKEELEQVYKSQKNQLMEELQISREREISLNGQIGELKKERDELQMELDRALKEAEELREKLKQAPVRQMSQFSEFSLSEIEEATQSFDESLKIGQGGYGNIYKGLLHQTEVAIKTLQPNSSQGTSEFQMEVHVLSQLRHPNLVKLFGYCPEVFALIYEYLPNGSLEDRLRCRDNNPPLSWKTRIRIATELCSVLVYLHSSKPHGIVHGDLKPSNILLDANFISKLSDFGICRMLQYGRDSSNNATLSHITVPKGTVPYIDPDFFQTGVLTTKADVYSFGIILLQLLTGRPPFSLSNDVKQALEAGNLEALLDPLAGDWPIVHAQKLARLGLKCCDVNRKSRPDLGSDVWKVLEPLRVASS